VAIAPGCFRAAAPPGTAANAPAPAVAKPLIVLPPELRNEGNTTGWISPTAIDFGSHPAGTTTSKEITVKTTGGDALYIVELKFWEATDFRLVGSSCPGLSHVGIPASGAITCPSRTGGYNPAYNAIALGSECTCKIAVSFEPASVGSKIGALMIDYNSFDDSPAVINFTGTATPAQTGGGSSAPQPAVRTGARPPLTTVSITPSALDFGGEEAGLSHTKSFKLENTGSEPLYISSLSLSDSAEFGIADNECPMAPQSVPPFTSCKITADFAPQTPGKTDGTEGTLTIAANTEGGAQTVALSGRTIPCRISMGYAPQPPRVSERLFPARENTVLKVDSAVGWSEGLIENSMTLLQVDSQGNQIAVLGELRPTGNQQYTGQFNFNEPSPGLVYVAVRAYYSGFPGCRQSTNNELPIQAVEEGTATRESSAKAQATSLSSQPESAASGADECSVNYEGRPYTPAPYTPMLTPENFFKGTVTSVTAKTFLPPDPGLIPGSVELNLVDAHGKELAKLASLQDDGTHSNEYAGQFSVEGFKTGSYSVAARARYQAGPTCRQSYSSAFKVYPQPAAPKYGQPSNAKIEAYLSRTLAMQTQFSGRDKALASVLERLRRWQGGTARICPDGKTICLKYKDGREAIIGPNPAELKRKIEAEYLQKHLSNPQLAIVEQKVTHEIKLDSMRLQVTSMKLLAPGIGWAVTDFGRKLYWTTNDGEKWDDITPPNVRSEDLRVAQVFFLDTHTGWALLSSFKPELQTMCDSGQPHFELVSDNIQLACGNGNSEPPQLKFLLAFTADGGATWSSWPIKIAGVNQPPFSPYVRLSFADSLHGWLNFGFVCQTDSRTLLATNDGGRSWRFAPNSPPKYDFVDEIELVTPQEGFALQTSGQKLFVTRDGAHSWQEIKVTPPKEAGAPTYSSYSMPIFTDSKHGYLPVVYGEKIYGPASGLTAAALFVTDDGGRTWKVNRIIKNLGDRTFGEPIPSTIADDVWILSAGRNNSPKLTELKAGERIDAPVGWGYLMNQKLSFLTPDRGWLLQFDGWLQATGDGGSSWTEITPGMPSPETHSIIKPACPLAAASSLSISGGYGYPGQDFGAVSAVAGSNTEIVPDSVRLVQVDGSGNEIADLGQMYVGSPEAASAVNRGYSASRSNDEQSAGIQYQGKFRVDPPVAGQVTLAARAAFKNPPTCRQSESYVLPIKIEPTEAEVQAEREAKQNIAGFFAGQRTKLGDDAARKAAVEFAKGQPDVLDAGIANDGISIWVKSKAGTDTMVLENPAGPRGAASSPK